jgi:hypothetical protein
MNLIIHDGKVIDISYGILPEHLKHISLPVDSIRKLGCEWIVNEQKCRKKCAPFLFVCDDHKNIPDFHRHRHCLLRIYENVNQTIRRRKHF